MNERKQETKIVEQIFKKNVLYISQGLVSNVISPFLVRKSKIIDKIDITFEASYGYLEVEDSRDKEVINFGFKIMDAKFIGANRYLKFKLINLLAEEELKRLLEITASIIKGISSLLFGQMLENELILNSLHNGLVIRENDGVYYLDFSNFKLSKFNSIIENIGIVNISIKNKRLAIKLGDNQNKLDR